MTKYKLQEMPTLNGVGEKRVYPKMMTNRQLGTKEFIAMTHYRDRAIPESLVTTVLTDLADSLVDMLSMGYTVKLDGLGTFSLSLDFDDEKPVNMKSEDDKMTYRKVTVKDMNFKAAPEIIKALKRKTDLERDMGGVSRLYKKKYTQEERIARTTAWMEKHGFITLQEYANLNNLSRTTASLELKKLTHVEDAPFDYKGRGSHKIWIKKS